MAYPNVLAEGVCHPLKEAQVTRITILKGVSDKPPTVHEIIVRINQKKNPTEMQRAILRDFLGRK